MTELCAECIPRCVIFDFHGVLTDSALPALNMPALSRDPSPMTAVERLETGKIGIAEFLLTLPTHSPSGRRFRISIRPQVLARAQSLREKGVRIALLTNTFRGFAGIRASAGVPDDMFDAVVESWREGVRKPDPVIFIRTLERLRSTADQCLLIDDELLNIHVAERLGFAVIHSKNECQTLRRLNEIFDYN